MNHPKNKKQANTRARKSNRQIMLVTWTFVILMISMTGYICYYAFTHKQEMVNNDYNGMQQILMAQNTRGSILASGGEILAETRTDPGNVEVRVYPYENLFSHVVGYATKGRSGIEATANYYLIQSNALLSQKAANAAAGMKNPGDNVHTTLRVDLQEVASKSLGIYKGAIVVTIPATGEILAMVSKPDFAPSDIPVDWEEMLADKDSGILLNRATQGLYPPGSTFKIITALEYIRQNNMDLTGYRYNCPGYFISGDERINCYHGSSHGQVDFNVSFAKSCNSSFANIGLSLDKGSFIETLDNLLFNQELPLSMHYNQSRLSLTEDITEADMMQITIGQGKTQITPVHLNMITSAIANKGVLMKPYMIDSVKDLNGNIIKQNTPSAYGNLISEEEAQILGQLMENVVESGTATKLQDSGYTAAGKTGSAEFGTVKGESHAWFTGYAPADNPQLCVTVIIEGAGAGGDYAVPIAKRIFDAYFN